MTKKDYASSDNEGKHCNFRLTNGANVTGIVAAFFPDEPETFYYVSTGNIASFNSLAERKNYSEMKKYCVLMDLSYITAVSRIGKAKY